MMLADSSSSSLQENAPLLPRILALGKSRCPGGGNTWCPLTEAEPGNLILVAYGDADWSNSLAYVVFVNDEWIMTASRLYRDFWTFHRCGPRAGHIAG